MRTIPHQPTSKTRGAREEFVRGFNADAAIAAARAANAFGPRTMMASVEFGFYNALGCKFDATPDEMKKAFRSCR